MKKLALTTALVFAALAGPAAAKDHSDRSDHGDKAKPKTEHGQSEQAKGHKCMVHGSAYVAGGTLESGSLTQNADGSYDGTLTVKVSRANHHAQADRATSKAYTLTGARVKLHGQDPAALKPGSRVKLQGKVTRLNAKCDQSAFTATTTIKRVTVKDPTAAEDGPAETETPGS